MVAFAPEPDFGGFLMLLSRLSLHTRSLLEHPRASLAISEPDTGAGNPQTLARGSIQGEATPITEDMPGYAEARAVYEKRLPASSPLFGFEDFSLFRLVPREARFVAGFARAYTVSAEELKEATSGHDSGEGRARGSI
jgi:putative heme iron utilization protein